MDQPRPDETGTTAPPRAGALARLFRRLAGRTDGAAAVEFAFVSLPFLAMLFAILETAMIFFVGQMLDSATAQISRQIRTGQAHQAGWTSARMSQLICDNMVGVSGCASKLRLDVRTYDSFGAVNLGSPLDEDGNFQNLQFNMGATSQIVVVRAYYTWPSFFDLLQTTNNSLANGDRLLASVVAFRNEPFN